MRRFRAGPVVVVALLLLVNLPLVHGWWVSHRIESDGVDVIAEVTDSQATSGGGGLVEFRFDETIDPEQRDWQAALGARAFDQAEDLGTIGVTVLPDDPARYQVRGEQGAGLIVALTVFADVVLLLALLLLVRRRPTGPMRLVALEDVHRAKPGGRLEQLTETTYLVVGEVVHVAADEVGIDVGGREVRVALGDFTNPVGYEQPAQVRCGVPESPA